MKRHTEAQRFMGVHVAVAMLRDLDAIARREDVSRSTLVRRPRGCFLNASRRPGRRAPADAEAQAALDQASAELAAAMAARARRQGQPRR